jgi:hypothetical protein
MRKRRKEDKKEEHSEEEGAVIENDSGIAKEAAGEPAVGGDEYQ